MALLQDLIQQIDDSTLRERILLETNKLMKQKKFGLVFEEHLPECTPLYDVPIRVGSKVALKTGYVSDIYIVMSIEGDTVICDRRETHEQKNFNLNELVVVAEFGEPIYPTLKMLDSVENAPDSDLWHTLIEADNYHALQLLEYLYAEKVDCIYIDPPYNTGAKDWKYNNDYVDSSDSYRHSKWLSMIEKRLKLAKRLLNPDTGVLIVTIDEHEMHHLRTLMDELFPEAYIQMVTYVINPKGVTQGRFSRVEEYAIYCFMPHAMVPRSNDNLLNLVEDKRTFKPRWKVLLRSGTNSRRADRKNMFYPIYVDLEKKRVVSAGEALPFDEDPILNEKVGDYYTAWPIRTDGTYGNWGVGYETLNELIKEGYVSLGGYDKKRNTYAITYVSQPNREKIANGEIVITGRDATTGVVNIEFASNNNKTIKTIWHRTLHDAGAYGTDIVSSIIGKQRTFSFPKSIYSERDAIAAVVRDNKNALILDFFAGSGTTLNAVNLLNVEDQGNRRCILVTNNETSIEESKAMLSDGIQPGDAEWQKAGICQSVTWPRTKYSILGQRDDGTVLDGKYFMTKLVSKEVKRNCYQMNFVTSNPSKEQKKQLVSVLRNKQGKAQLPQKLVSDLEYIVSEDYSASILFDVAFLDEWLDELQGQEHITDFYICTTDKKIFAEIKNKLSDTLGTYSEQELEIRQMSDGFKTNAAFFRLGFLDKTSIALGRQFKELLPVLWMKGGAIGKCPLLEENNLPEYLILEKNKMAVLLDEIYYSEFDTELEQHPEIQTVFIVTDSEVAYRSMIRTYDDKNCYQLYRDYLDNFRINTGR
ncbi:MAG: site-specific DNA-methyltransferase [Eubacteriales bacterium]|nr:site-specific DNA-methyltransferase [Eubacteriales bacterium]